MRLKHHDYRQPGAYFVTICTHGGRSLFGNIVNEDMSLNELGKVVHDEWLNTEKVRQNVELDSFVVMPNHIHGIIFIVDERNHENRATHRVAPTRDRPTRVEFSDARSTQEIVKQTERNSPTMRQAGSSSNTLQAGSLGAIIGQFKIAVTRRLKQAGAHPDGKIWQRGFYERVILSEKTLNRTRAYIVNNPPKWHEDSLFLR